MPTIGQPKRTRKKNAFATWQSVNILFLRSISKYEAVLHKLAFNRLDRAADTLIGSRQKAGDRHQEQTGIECVRPVILGEGFLVGVVATFANFRVNLIANFL